jgi:Protein of unknown function (DUF4230)
MKHLLPLAAIGSGFALTAALLFPQIKGAIAGQIKQTDTLRNSAITALASINQIAVLEQSHNLTVDAVDEFSILGSATTILNVEGTVKSGYDLRGLAPGNVTIDSLTKAVTIKLPAPTFTDIRLNLESQKVWFSRKGLALSESGDLLERAQGIASRSLASKACESGILPQTNKVMVERLQSQLKAAGATSVTVLTQESTLCK